MLNELRVKNMHRIIIGHININSLRYKFNDFDILSNKNLDIILISETKLDASFPSKQFVLDGYSLPFRLDKSNTGGGLLLFIKEGIPTKLLPTNFTQEGIFMEINLKKKKWLFLGGYNPDKSRIKEYLAELSTNLDQLIVSYENIIVMGDFNSETTEAAMIDFCDMYGLSNLIRKPTCYKNPIKPSCIDLILTNKEKSFQNSNVYETGLSDFHKLTVTVLKMSYQKLKPIIISYRDYKNYNNQDFRDDLLEKVNSSYPNLSEDEFENIFLGILNLHAPLKHKHIRGNQQPFFNKELSKAIMKRSKLRNIYLKNTTLENRNNYVRHRNYCVNLLRKTKRDYYSNLKISDITDNKSFWKSVKPSFTDKVNTNEQITLVENGEIITDSSQIAKTMNDFFSNVVELLEIPNDNDSITINAEGINDPIEQAIHRYSHHPSILKINETHNEYDIFFPKLY